jgi:hypothetical protein
VTREPHVTTILPTYCRPTLLKRAALSVLNQSFPDFVVEILDNASSDDTEEAARELTRLDSRIRYYRHPENIGSLSNMIYGMERVRTPYFNILCDDDLLMPEFFATGVRMHEEGERPAAFVSTRVAVLDETGVLSTPFAHPAGRCRMLPPDGMAHCIKAGVSLPGVLYRTGAIREIGAPRTAWWNWTESGWHAIAAITNPIAFSPDVGAVMFDHLAGGSKRMAGTEFRISWFRMLAEVREAAARSGVSDSMWITQVRTHQYAMFAATCVRISQDRDPAADDELRELGCRSGLSPTVVDGLVAAVKAVRLIGAGGLVNDAADGAVRFRAALGRLAGDRQILRVDQSLAQVSSVLLTLNGQAGVEPFRAT